MKERIEKIKDAGVAIIERQRQAGHPVERVHISLGGDMIEGCWIYAGQNVTGLDRTSNTHQLIAQIRETSHMIAEVVMHFAAHVQNVDVISVPGNHGRTNGKNDISDPNDNFDTLCALWAQDLCKENADRVRWNIGDETWFNTFSVLGWDFVTFHGDQWKGKFEKIESLLPGYLVDGVFGTRPDVVLTHHRHDFAVKRIGGIPVIQNGTIDGGSEWYLKAFGKSSPPEQTVIVVGENYAPESLWPIYFD
jgi:hypothetical protein